MRCPIVDVERKSTVMKELLIIVYLLCGALAEAPAPYPPRGWRPRGPAFELPAKESTQAPQTSEYLPPVDPRNNRPELASGDDVSVQGLPAQEQLPIFQVSPINGQQYVGPNFNSDIKNLEQNFQQSQFQLQQEKARQLSRQQQFLTNPNAANGLPNPQPPRQFVPQTTTATPTTPRRPKQAEPTTERNSNREEIDESDAAQEKKKISVEVSKQNIQEYPAELFLSSLVQTQLQPQFVPLQQFSQIKEQVYYQPEQGNAPAKQVAGFDGPTHFTALPSVLGQSQLSRQQQPLIPAQQAFVQNPVLVPQRQEQAVNPIIVAANQEPLAQYQPQLNQAPQPLPQYQPVINQYQPAVSSEVVQAPLSPYQSAVSQLQSAVTQYQPAISQFQPAVGQYQPAVSQYQPAVSQYQPALSQYQPAVNPYQPAVNQYQPAVSQYQPAVSQYQPAVNQYQPSVQEDVEQVTPQYQPAINQYQPVAQPFPQYQAQPVIYQPQLNNQVQPQNVQEEQQEDTEKDDNNAEQQPQYVYHQPQFYQPQEVYQSQYPQPANQFYGPPQSAEDQANQQDQFYQNEGQFATTNQPDAPPTTQGQDAFLQSGLDVNKEGNGIDQAEEDEEEATEDEQEVNKATAIATAFGTRTQPRVFSQYGVPASNPRESANRRYQTTTESTAEETTEDVPAVAQATAVANPSRNRSAKLRSRRPRPVFTVDRSGHLVLARE